jgi:DNA polymerase-3 subunit beta
VDNTVDSERKTEIIQENSSQLRRELERASAMKITVDPKKLKKALDAVLPIAKQSSGINDLAGLMQLNAEASGEVTIRSASYDGRVRSSLTCDVEIPGAVCLNGEELENVLSKVKTAEVTLTLGKGTMAIAAGRARFRLGVYPDDSFYEWPASEKPQYGFTLTADEAEELFGSVLHARKNDKSLSDSISGVFLDPGKDVISVVATDGHRLALRCIGIEKSIANVRGVLLSPSSIDRLVTCARGGEEIAIDVASRTITISTKDKVYDMQLLGSVFPDYRRVIPARAEAVTVLDRKDFIETVDRLMSIRPDLGRISIRITNDSIHVQAQRDTNLASEDIDLEYTVDTNNIKADQQGLEFDIDGKFLMDALKAMTGTLVELHLHGTDRPVTLRPHLFVQDATDVGKALDLIMPLS